MKQNVPTNLKYKPIIVVDYETKDAEAGDAKFLSIGYAQWNSKREDFSAKVFRKSDKRWSMQSEELPLWRVLDLATLLVSVINDKQSNLEEFVHNEESLGALKDYLKENMLLYAPRMQELRRLLEPQTHSSSNNSLPNIFSYATSELSQDAMFAWLLSCASPIIKKQDSSLYDVACSFLRLILGQPNYVVNKMNVGRQWQNIDVWAEINDNAFLIIEDKVETSIHSNQLERYKEIVKKEYEGKRDQLFFVYIKTGNEPKSTLKEIEEKGYRTILRHDIIKCLNSYNGNNSLLKSYLSHLIEIENDTQSFRTLPVSEWGWYAWQGFYKELESRLNLTSWNYVANPSGGFLGAWWHFMPIVDGEMYLQFEERKLCFKICYEGNGDRSAVRNKMHDILMSLAFDNNYPEITKPTRFGAGHYMTIAIVNPDYLFGNTIVEIDEIVKKLETYQQLINECCKEYK